MEGERVLLDDLPRVGVRCLGVDKGGVLTGSPAETDAEQPITPPLLCERWDGELELSFAAGSDEVSQSVVGNEKGTSNLVSKYRSMLGQQRNELQHSGC